jgi:uncharacterized protein YutD
VDDIFAQFDVLQGKNGANALCIREYFDDAGRELRKNSAAIETLNRL